MSRTWWVAVVALGLSACGPRYAKKVPNELVVKLLDAYRANATEEWRWFESTLTYDNALLPFALFAAYSITGERPALRSARARARP